MDWIVFRLSISNVIRMYDRTVYVFIRIYVLILQVYMRICNNECAVMMGYGVIRFKTKICAVYTYTLLSLP